MHWDKQFCDQCKAIIAEYKRSWYKKNQPARRAYNADWMKQWRARKRKLKNDKRRKNNKVNSQKRKVAANR